VRKIEVFLPIWIMGGRLVLVFPSAVLPRREHSAFSNEVLLRRGTMKRTISIGVLCACLAPIAPAQQQPVLPHWGRHLGALPAIASQDAAASLQLSSPQAVKIFDLGHYPGGTWAEPRDINDFGLVVAFGDVPPDGYTHPIAAPIFGLAAGKWFDLGTLGGERYDEVMCMGVADTGLIVGHAALQDDVTIHAFAWTPATGMVDIGVLTDQGFNFSLAYEVNRSGSLIVGFSGSGWYSSDTLPVVWTRNLVWASGRPALQWTISKLDTRGFDGSTGWYATSVNNAGQIIGMAVGPPPDYIQQAFVWNPMPTGGWKIVQLPVTPDLPNAYPSSINNRGEIVGYAAKADWSIWFPALWEPAGPSASHYNLVKFTSLTGTEQGWAEANGNNDLGDIVGDSYDANGNDIATRWTAKDPNSIDLLGFPGTWSFAEKVNNPRIAVGAFGSDTIPEDVAAVQIPGTAK
jgi:probable HAF family extracellular repeat protein